MRPEDVSRNCRAWSLFATSPSPSPPTWRFTCFRAWRRDSVKVVLAGEGGDELFAGYPKYAADPLAGLVSALPLPSRTPWPAGLPYRQRRARIALETLSLRDRAERYATWFASFSRPEREASSRRIPGAIEPDHPAQVFETYLAKDAPAHAAETMLYADLKIWLPDNLLLRGDLMTMAASIEERVPFLDHKLVEFAARLPTPLLTRGLRTKVLLKQAFEQFLPRRFSTGAKWVSPCRWASGSENPQRCCRRTWCSRPRRCARGYFNAANMERFVREHFDGVRDRQKQLWALLNFELWCRHAK